ncbi:MAG: hypothetical protein LJE94_10390 [Deltaproteobacteria bacterium]|nr:hypothetical protein [Deltaproteobacteria bacterium]
METYIRIAALESILEAQLVEAILKERGIPHRIRSFHDTAYDGLFQFQKGWGELYGPASSKEAIREILDMVRQEN